MKESIMPQPVKRPITLDPIKVPAPPKNTQIKPRCLTCTHFDVCKYRSDYLKTITVTQQALGDPLVAMEVKPEQRIPEFHGITITNWQKYFPTKVSLTDFDVPLVFNLAKYQSMKDVSILYQTPKNFIMFRFEYDSDKNEFQLESCKDAFYFKIDYEVNEEDLEILKAGLLEWRQDAINEKIIPLYPLPPKKDVINTTHFSAVLECDLYEWNHTDYNSAIKYYKTAYPNGIPIDETGQYYHIATFHIDNQPIPYSPLYYDETGVVDNPLKKENKSAKKRKDLE